MNTCIRFQCPSCRARIKAPLLLAGRTRNCPGCERVFTVPRSLPEDAGPMLVPMEGADYYKLGILRRESLVRPAAYASSW